MKHLSTLLILVACIVVVGGEIFVFRLLPPVGKLITGVAAAFGLFFLLALLAARALPRPPKI